MKKEVIVPAVVSLVVGLGIGAKVFNGGEQNEEVSEEVESADTQQTSKPEDSGDSERVAELERQVKELKHQLKRAETRASTLETQTKVAAKGNAPIATTPEVEEVPDDSPDTRERLALDLVELTGIKDTLDSQLDTLSETMAAQIGADAETQARVDSVLREVLDWDKLKGKYVDIYKDTFTSNEIAQLNAFYQSKAGRDFVAKQPELMKKSLKLMEEFTAKNQDKILQALTGGSK